MGTSSCTVCSSVISPIPSQPSSLSCTSCSKAFYCTSACKLKDSTATHHTCLPYTIHHEDRCGRLLMAARDIRAGETIFCDTPGAVGPDNNPKPVCLTCYKRLPGLIYRCRYCGWPLCSPFCQDDNGPHTRECSLFQIHSPRFNIEDYKATCPSYNAIMVLRLLWLRDNQPEDWKLIDMLMDHLDEDKELTKTKQGVLSFILEHCKLKQFSKAEILHVMGVIDTNAYIIGENPNKDVDIQGLFPITSILNHACTANTICYARDDFTFVCRAVTDIKKGEELTTNYLHYHYHFFGLSYRGPELSSFWHFKCGCRRCKDPTEFGTMSDSLVCPECTLGRLTPLSDSRESDWICGTCYGSQTPKFVENKINHWWNVIDESPKFNVLALDELLKKLLAEFDASHYYCMEIKRRLIENIGETKGYEYESADIEWLERKIRYCEEHLKLQNILAPGLSEYKAYMAGHLAESRYWVLKKNYVGRSISGQELSQGMQGVAHDLFTVVQIWGPYRRRSSEKLKAEHARDLLSIIQEKYDVGLTELKAADRILSET